MQPLRRSWLLHRPRRQPFKMQLASEQAAHAATQRRLDSEELAHLTLKDKYTGQFILVYRCGKVEVTVGAQRFIPSVPIH